LLDLRGKEFDLLAQLVNSLDALHREDLLAFGFMTLRVAIELWTFIFVEKKELDPANPDYIQTVWVSAIFKVSEI